MAQSSITYTDKIEDSGATADGRYSAANANEVKSVANANATDAQARFVALEANDTVLVATEADLPTQVGGIISLEAKNYVAVGTVVITNKLKPPKDATCRLSSTNAHAWVYTGVDTMLETADLGAGILLVQNCILVASTGTLYDITSLTNNGSVIFDTVIINGVSTLGSMTGIRFTNFLTNVFDIGQGVVFTACPYVVWSQSNIDATRDEVGSVFITVSGACGTVQINNNFVNTAGVNETVFDIEAGSSVTAGMCQSGGYNLSAGGALFAGGSKDYSDPYWKFLGNVNIPDSSMHGKVTQISNTDATSVSDGTPIKLDFTTPWTVGDSERMTPDTTGRITSASLETVNVNVMFNVKAISVTGTGNDANFYIAKNGSAIPTAVSSATLGSSAAKSITGMDIVSMAFGDYIELFIEGDGNSTDAVVSANKFIAHL